MVTVQTAGTTQPSAAAQATDTIIVSEAALDKDVSMASGQHGLSITILAQAPSGSPDISLASGNCNNRIFLSSKIETMI